MGIFHLLNCPILSSNITSYYEVRSYVRILPDRLSKHVEHRIDNEWIYPEVYNPTAYYEFVIQAILEYTDNESTDSS